MGKKTPNHAVIDSQSSKTNNRCEAKGFDGNKKVKGRKRHISTDTQGRLLHAEVHAANNGDTIMGTVVAKATVKKFKSVKTFSVDMGYRGTF